MCEYIPKISMGPNNQQSRNTCSLYFTVIYTCCILKTRSHRLCNNNVTDVAQEVMLHNMQHIIPEEVRLCSVLLRANAKNDWTQQAATPPTNKIKIAILSITTANFEN